MEMNELRYFLAVAKTENMHKASLEIGVSAGSLSKAIRRLENELKVKLFTKVGRNIVLSEHGIFLKKRGNELLGLEQNIKTEIMGQQSAFKVVIAGSEILLSSYGVELTQSLKHNYENITFQLDTVEESSLLAKVRDGEVDIGISTYDIPSDFDQKALSTISFKTYISKNHSLYKESKKRPIHIDEVLKHPFVLPKTDLLGRINKSDSRDGWRDDKFPRLIGYVSTSLKVIENLVYAGEAIAYLPEYLNENSSMHVLEIIGCPYYCKQKVKIFTKDKKRSGWINSLF